MGPSPAVGEPTNTYMRERRGRERERCRFSYSPWGRTPDLQRGDRETMAQGESNLVPTLPEEAHRETSRRQRTEGQEAQAMSSFRPGIQATATCPRCTIPRHRGKGRQLGRGRGQVPRASATRDWKQSEPPPPVYSPGVCVGGDRPGSPAGHSPLRDRTEQALTPNCADRAGEQGLKSHLPRGLWPGWGSRLATAQGPARFTP